MSDLDTMTYHHYARGVSCIDYMSHPSPFPATIVSFARVQLIPFYPELARDGSKNGCLAPHLAQPHAGRCRAQYFIDQLHVALASIDPSI